MQWKIIFTIKCKLLVSSWPVRISISTTCVMRSCTGNFLICARDCDVWINYFCPMRQVRSRSKIFMPRHKKWRGIMLYPPNFWVSVRLSVRPSVRQRLNIRVRSITLIPFEIISGNLVQIKTMIRRHAEIKNRHSTYIFCGIIPLWNFQYRNCVRSITLIPFEIISQNLVEI